MDEDDVFAIVTRQLITDHSFFKWGENDWENARVKTDSGKNLTNGQTYFTQIEVLYEMTEDLLTSALRANAELADSKRSKFKQVRPADYVIAAWYDEVALIWDVLIEVIPDLRTGPMFMRTHNPNDDDSQKSDHLWFWPIGQQMVARVVRLLIDHSAADGENPLDREKVRNALSILGRINWDLHELPWRHLVLVTGDDDVWRMRSEGRTDALKVAEQLLLWITGIVDLGDTGVAALRDRWEFKLYQAKDDPDVMWNQITQVRVIAAGSNL